jgi:hypothetical protein
MHGKWEAQEIYCEGELIDKMKYNEYWLFNGDSATLFAINRNGDNYCYHKLTWIMASDSIYYDINGGPLYCGWNENKKINVVQYKAGFSNSYQTNTFFVKEYLDVLPPSIYPVKCF